MNFLNPQIALFSCVIFIFWLLRSTGGDRSDFSKALWIPSIWMMIVGSRPISLWLTRSDGRETAAVDVYSIGSSLDRNIYSFLIIIALIILLKRKVRWGNIIKRNLWLFGLLAFSGVSIVWSDFPYVALKRYIKEFGNIVMVMVVLTEKRPEEAIKALFRRCSYVLIPLSVVIFKYFSLGRYYHRWSGELSITGVTTNKNSLGVLCLVCGLFLIWSIIYKLSTKTEWRPRGKTVFFQDVLILATTIWLLSLADSMTSWACFILGSFIMIVLEFSSIKKRIGSIGKYFLFMTFMWVLLEITIGINKLIIESLGRDTTLTGRNELWALIIDMVKNPLIGTGYQNFFLGERLAVLWDTFWWKPITAHSGYLETYIDLGFVGLALLLMLLISSYSSIANQFLFDLNNAKFRMAFLLISILYNVTETAFQGIHIIWFCLMLLIINYRHVELDTIETGTYNMSKNLNKQMKLRAASGGVSSGIAPKSTRLSAL